MKRALLLGATLVAAFALGGCPIYPDQGTACVTNSDCGSGYQCDYSSGLCVLSSGSGGSGGGAQCSKPSDCQVNETCGPDGRCHTGDCTFQHGCVAGYQCQIANGTWMCVPSGGAGGAAGSSSGGAAGSSTGGTAGSSTGGTAGTSTGGAGGTTGTAGATGSGGTAGATGSGGTSGAGGTAGATGAAGSGGTSADAGPDGSAGQSDAGTPADASAD